MKKELLRFTLYAIIIYLTVGALWSAGAATHPLARNGTHFCGVSEGWANKRYSDQYPNRRYARRAMANLNVGEPRTVRMIYFLPNDRPYRADVVQRMKDEILKVQTFYAEQMEAHGYGRRTFRVETDAQGEPKVHRVDGQQGNDGNMSSELEQVGFDITANVYLIVMDLVDDAGGYGSREGKNGGAAVLLGNVWFVVAAHELGHAFGLPHDFRDQTDIMSYGERPNRLSACAADYLSVHPYFNPDTPIEEGPPPSIELISSRRYPAGAKSFPIRLKVRGSAGLHRVLLSTSAPILSYSSVKSCRRLKGEREVVVEFNYDGTNSTPSNPQGTGTSLSDPLAHSIAIELVDTDGNVDFMRFPLYSEAFDKPLMKISGDNQVGLPNTPLPAPFVVHVLNLFTVRDQGGGVPGVPLTFTVTAGGGTLSVEHTWVSFETESTLTLGPNLGTNTVEVSAEGFTVTFNAEAVAPEDIPYANLPDPNLQAAIENTLGVSPGTPIAPSGMVALTRLEAPNANISDLTGLESATNLTGLWLGVEYVETERRWLNSNSVSNLSPLAELTKLTKLSLRNNNISDISPLAGLANLTQLWADNNNITDISTVIGLTNLTYLNLGGNNITDILPVAGLTNLTNLALANNGITDIAAVVELTHLTELHLGWNKISDISPLIANAGLRNGDKVYVQANPLSYQSIHKHIPILQSRGVTVEFDNRAHSALLKISGDNQNGASFALLSQPLVVEAQDANGSALGGIPVTFAVTAGGGTLSTTITRTDNNGRAQSTLILGPNLGTNTVSVSATGIESTATFHAIADTLPTEFLWSIPRGISLVHVPLEVTAVNGMMGAIESISDLYNALGGAGVVNFLITYDSSTQEWRSYFGIVDKGTPADAKLADDTGIIVSLRRRVSRHLSGTPLGTDGSSTLTLNEGLNLVGLPLRDSRIRRVSDLFKLDGIGGNVPVIILTDGDTFTLVGRAGDPGDIAITGGQGFIMTAQRAATVTLSGDGWYNAADPSAAPQVALKGIEVKHTTPVLALRGAVVDNGAGLKVSNFRVTVKNLSSGRAVATAATPDEAGYQLTVVDIETGRAATVGDILEIVAKSPDPSVGIQPLRYTVTAEDVKRSYIQLPDLGAYEIPAETELLSNYPNPFNPETWIPYRLAEDALVTLTIYDGSGRVVRSLDVGHQVAAVYESRSKAIYWDGRNEFGEQVASGLYFYHLSAGDYSATRRMVILK